MKEATKPAMKVFTLRLEEETWLEFRKKLLEEGKTAQGWFLGEVEKYLKEE